MWRSFRVLGIAPAVLLAACAARPPLTSSLPAAVSKEAAVSYVGRQPAPLAPGQVETAAQQLLKSLVAAEPEGGWDPPARFRREPGGIVALSLDAAQTFEDGSGQMKLPALATCAAIADAAKTADAVVLHILVLGEMDDAANPAESLPARRAEALLEYFLRRGFAGTRVRAEGRASGAPAVEIVLKPVVLGREAEAWRPPAPGA